MVLFLVLILVLEEIEEQTVVVVYAGSDLLHPKQRMEGDHLQGYMQHVLLLNQMGYDGLVLPEELNQPLE